jgi:hypothetical protein
MTLRVTVVDVETGDEETQEVAQGDYVLVCHEPCHLDYVQTFKTGTVQLTIKGRTAP